MSYSVVNEQSAPSYYIRTLLIYIDTHKQVFMSMWSSFSN